MRSAARQPVGRISGIRAVVSSQSLIRFASTRIRSSRLIGHTLRVELYEPELKVYLGRDLLFCLPRLRGDRGALVTFATWCAAAAQARSLHPLPAPGSAVSEHHFPGRL